MFFENWSLFSPNAVGYYVINKIRDGADQHVFDYSYHAYSGI